MVCVCVCDYIRDKTNQLLHIYCSRMNSFISSRTRTRIFAFVFNSVMSYKLAVDLWAGHIIVNSLVLVILLLLIFFGAVGMARSCVSNNKDVNCGSERRIASVPFVLL